MGSADRLASAISGDPADRRPTTWMVQGTVVSVLLGGAVDGGPVVTVDVLGEPVVAVYDSSYAAGLTVGRTVLLLIQRDPASMPVIIARLAGTPA